MPLPGVEKLLSDLRSAHSKNGKKVEIAWASSSEKYNYDRKVVQPETKTSLSAFDDDR